MLMLAIESKMQLTPELLEVSNLNHKNEIFGYTALRLAIERNYSLD